MITKIEFFTIGYQTVLKNDEIKKLLSETEIKTLSKNYFFFNKNGKATELVVDQDESGSLIIHYRGNIFLVEISKSVSGASSNLYSEIQKERLIKSPMPGLISKIKVKPGDKVRKGDALFTIEAMKMENEIKSHISGIVETVKVSEGTVVDKNAVLIILKPSTINE